MALYNVSDLYHLIKYKIRVIFITNRSIRVIITTH